MTEFDILCHISPFEHVPQQSLRSINLISGYTRLSHSKYVHESAVRKQEQILRSLFHLAALVLHIRCRHRGRALLLSSVPLIRLSDSSLDLLQGNWHVLLWRLRIWRSTLIASDNTMTNASTMENSVAGENTW